MASRARLIEVCQQIQADAEDDALTIDGTPMTGAALGARLGEMLASIEALARISESILKGEVED